MRTPLLPLLLLPPLLSCVAPVEYQGWSRGTLKVAVAIEQKGEELAQTLLTHFEPGTAEFESARRLGDRLQQEYAAQTVAWRMLEAYLADVDIALTRRAPDDEPVEGISRAFHELHVRLLHTGLARSYGLSVEDHKEASARILACQTSSDAMEAAHPVIATLSEHLAEACSELVGIIEEGEREALALLDHRYRQDLDARALLRKRQTELRQALAMEAAGAGVAEGEPETELLEVEQLLGHEDLRFAEYRVSRRAISDAFLFAADHARKSSHAVLEWGIAHREVVKAMQRGDSHANMRLFERSVEELTR